MLFLTLFVVTMALTGGVYMLVDRTIQTRDAKKVRDRLSGKQDKQTTSVAATPLFLPEGGAKGDIMSRLLKRFSLDRHLQELAEQAGVTWAPGQVVVAALLLGLVAFNLVWYWVPWNEWLGVRGGPGRGFVAVYVDAAHEGEAYSRIRGTVSRGSAIHRARHAGRARLLCFA